MFRTKKFYLLKEYVLLFLDTFMFKLQVHFKRNAIATDIIRFK